MNERRDYYLLIMICSGILLYILSEFIQKYPYHIILVIVSSAIFLILLLEAFFVYMRNTHKKSKKIFGAIIGAIVIILTLFILYLFIGLVTAFYVTAATALIGYVIAMITLFCSNGNKRKKEGKRKKWN